MDVIIRLIYRVYFNPPSSCRITRFFWRIWIEPTPLSDQPSQNILYSDYLSLSLSLQFLRRPPPPFLSPTALDSTTESQGFLGHSGETVTERERESSHAKARSIVGVLVSVHVRVIVREGPSLEAGTGVQDLVYTTYTEPPCPSQARGVYEHNSLKYSSADKKLPSRR